MSYTSFFISCCKAPPKSALQLGCWQPPLGNYFKLNTDRALFFDSQEEGISVILRDCKNEILMAASIKEMTLFQPEIMECLAICRGLQQCIPFGISHLVVESDCLSVVQQIQEAYLPPCGGI